MTISEAVQVLRRHLPAFPNNDVRYASGLTVSLCMNLN